LKRNLLEAAASLALGEKLKLKFISFLPALIWLLVTLILLVMPGSDVPTFPFLDLIYFDKWVHIGIFAVLTFLWSFPFLKSNVHIQKAFLLIAIASIGYGVLMEYVQRYFAVGRDFDVFDMLADAVGSMVALFWLFYFSELMKGPKNKPL
jgi:hypothetical protein